VKTKVVEISELQTAILDEPSTVLRFSHPSWLLPVQARKNGNSLTKFMRDAIIPNHQNCNTFPATIVSQPMKLTEFIQCQKKYPAYIQDYEIKRCKPLQNFTNTVLRVIEWLLNENLLSILDVPPDHPVIKKNKRVYTYINRYLYFGGEGTGTPLHWVCILFCRAKNLTMRLLPRTPYSWLQ